MSYSNSFTTPDELRAACAKSFPATTCQFCRPSLTRAIPSFHRLGHNAIADAMTTNVKRLC